MDVLIPNNWLKRFLDTKATPKEIAKYLSLSGPSIEKISKKNNDQIYEIEITTNRVDAVSIYGLAREATAILPRFKIPARLLPLKTNSKQKMVNQVSYLEVKVSHSLCPRFAAVLIKNVKVETSPKPLQERIKSVGLRPINNVVDISNFIMHELGQPVHTFDYDKISKKKMILRKSKKGEKITTLDGKKHTLPGNDIVIEDGKGRLIDLAGIMGGENSAVDTQTKNVLLFVQTYNPVNIRKTSMTLAQRSEASILFEKGLDTELVEISIRRGIDLFEKICKGKAATQILDLYPNPYKQKIIKTNLETINKKLGISLTKNEIADTLAPLGFSPVWKNSSLEVKVPNHRSNDISIVEDIVEEIARIYGYHNFPSQLMTGKLPQKLTDSPFDFEMQVKNILKGFGGIEVYTYSLVPKSFVKENALKLKNPLGKESEFLRDSLMPSLLQAAKENTGEKENFHLFEMANIYLPQKGNLPKETLKLGGIFSGHTYREAKGLLEALLRYLKINPVFEIQEKKGFLPNQHLVIKYKNKEIGFFGTLTQGNYYYYQLDVEKLRKYSLKPKPFKAPAKYPPQIEDLTIKLPAKTKVGKLINSALTVSKLIKKFQLKDVYKDAYTFRIHYQHPNKTLIDKEVEKIRNELVNKIKNKFGGILKN